MSARRVLVLGHRGLLGAAVTRRLRELGNEVITTELRVTYADVEGFARSVTQLGADGIINCIVALPPRLSEDRVSAFALNAILPLQLALQCSRVGTVMLQPSTDGVFRGDRGGYAVSDIPDATDAYGTAKAIAEFARAASVVTVVRCSIIGPGGGLLRWLFTAQRVVDGYIDHRWNGITVLEWADLAQELLTAGTNQGGAIVQPACESPVSKFELLRLAARAFGHDTAIRPVNSGQRCDRTLIPSVTMATIETQLARLREWSSTE